MAAEYSANAAQVVPVGSSVIFTESPVPCNRGLVYHRDDTGLFRLANRFARQNLTQCWRRNTNYEVAFHANIAVPEGETIPADDLPYIFDRFHKSDRSRSLDKEGVGLGLYLVKTIINAHDEDIAVRSEDGMTEFVFTLTLAENTKQGREKT